MPLKFAPLRLDFASSYAARTKEIVQTYHEANDSGVKQVVDIIYKAVQNHLDDLEDFVHENDTDDRSRLFQKSARLLRSMLQAPRGKKKKRADADAEAMETLGSPQAYDDNASSPQPYDENSMASPEKGLVTGATDAELSLINAAREEYKTSDMLERSIPLPSQNIRGAAGGPGRRIRSLYAWEQRVNSGVNPSSPTKYNIDTYLDIGDTFNFQIVLNRKDYHQMMNRRRIRKIEEDRKERERERAELEQKRRSNPLRGHVRRNSLEYGPYVEPSYKQRTMYRAQSKQRWVDPESGFSTY